MLENKEIQNRNEVENVESKVDDKGDSNQEIKNDENKINEENGDNQ